MRVMVATYRVVACVCWLPVALVTLVSPVFAGQVVRELTGTDPKITV